MLMNPATGAALLARGASGEAVEQPKPAAPQKHQQTAIAAPETLLAGLSVEQLGSPLAAMARAQARLPRPPRAKPAPPPPTSMQEVRDRAAAALRELEPIATGNVQAVRIGDRRRYRQVSHAVDAARRELERAKALAEGKPA
jgi:hypothetical protein